MSLPVVLATYYCVNQLYYGDNLQMPRDHIADESVDLIYLDPPFNSKRDYNLLFKSPVGSSRRGDFGTRRRRIPTIAITALCVAG